MTEIGILLAMSFWEMNCRWGLFPTIGFQIINGATRLKIFQVLKAWTAHLQHLTVPHIALNARGANRLSSAQAHSHCRHAGSAHSTNSARASRIGADSGGACRCGSGRRGCYEVRGMSENPLGRLGGVGGEVGRRSVPIPLQLRFTSVPNPLHARCPPGCPPHLRMNNSSALRVAAGRRHNPRAGRLRHVRR